MLKASADLSQARIYLTALGDESELETCRQKYLVAHAEHSAGCLPIASTCNMFPELIFHGWTAGCTKLVVLMILIDTVATHP